MNKKQILAAIKRAEKFADLLKKSDGKLSSKEEKEYYLICEELELVLMLVRMGG